MIKIRTYQQSMFKKIYLVKILVWSILLAMLSVQEGLTKIRLKGVSRSYRKLRKLLRPFSVTPEGKHDSATYRTNHEKAEETY